MEANANSRFVDYTMATPWEELVADIERCLTLWRKCSNEKNRSVTHRTEITYLGSKLVLTLFDKHDTHITNIPNWFDLENYAVLSRINDWIDLTPSECRSIFSALICGAQASGNSLPVFFCSTSLERIHNAFEVMGNEIVNHTSMRHYESSVLGTIDSKHELFYFDGVMNHFRNRMPHLREPNQSVRKVSIEESFVYEHDDSILYRYSKASDDEIFNDGNNHLKLRDLITHILRRSRSLVPPLPLLKSLTIQLTYLNLTVDSITDNIAYTTLIPSNQPATAWSAQAKFRDVPTFNKFVSTSSSPASVDGTSLGISSCVRRIFGLYIIGKSCEKRTVMADFMPNASNAEKATFVAALLSFKSREALDSLLVKHESIDSSRVDMSWAFLFHESLIEALKKSPALDNCDERCPRFCSWIGLLSMFTGCSQGSVETIGKEWAACLKKLRDNWNTGNVKTFPFFNSTDNSTLYSDQKVNPLWMSSLWNDVIERGAIDGCNLCLPNKSQSVITQKLQMLRFCTATKEVSLSYPVLMEAENSFIDLARRVPSTFDSDTMLNFMSEQIESGTQTVTEIPGDPYLKVKILLPALISDIKAFKSAFPKSEFKRFHDWYRLDTLASLWQKDNKYFSDLYYSLEPCPAQEQYPMFNAEREVEKAFSFLESLTITQFAAEILIAALATCESILRMDFLEFGGVGESNFDSLQEQDLNLLQLKVMDVIYKVRNDVAEFSGCDADVSISQDTLLEIDDVCELIDRLELSFVRAREIVGLLRRHGEINETNTTDPSQWNLASVISSKDVYGASNDIEGRYLFRLAKIFGQGNARGHNWVSHDGRELVSSNKTYIIETEFLKLRAKIEDSQVRFSTASLLQ